ncbi:5944_t:CDS:2 [Scutellospora calospora]|uniref:5944_t:CDS:1 n=1 Tax=Scutellospora calospora TaxID=85575 RepID=A0ACA9KS94_9GLOM|nr:5944_t:CDS:2 [Scutellospora calospora]
MSNQISKTLDDKKVSLRAHVYDKRIEFKNLDETSELNIDKYTFYDGCVVVEFWDHRNEQKCHGKRSILKHNQTSIWDEILRLNQETGASWTYEQAIQLEAQLLLALHPQLDLDIDPMLLHDKATNDANMKQIHRKLKKKKRKLNSYEVELEDAKRRIGKEFVPKYSQAKYFRSPENLVTETNHQAITRGITTPVPKNLIRTIEFQREYTDPGKKNKDNLFTLVYIYRDNNNGKYEVIAHAVKGKDLQENGAHTLPMKTLSLCDKYNSKLDDSKPTLKCELENAADYESFVKSFVILYMMDNKLLNDSERSNKIPADMIVQLAEEYSRESNQNELHDITNIDKKEPYQIVEFLAKKPISETKPSAFEYISEDGKKTEIKSIYDLYTAAISKKHATESTSMPPPPRPIQRVRVRPPQQRLPLTPEVVMSGFSQPVGKPPVQHQPQMVANPITPISPIQISQNSQSIQPPQTRPPIQNRPILSPQTMQRIIQLPNQPMPTQNPNHIPMNVQVSAQQAASQMIIQQRPVIATSPGKIPQKMVMQLSGMPPTLPPQSRQSNQNPVIVPVQSTQMPTQIPIQNNPQIQPGSQSTPGTPIQLSEQTQVQPVQRSPGTPMKSPARTSEPSTPMQTAQDQITQPSQRSAPNTPLQSPGQNPGLITPRPIPTNQLPMRNGIHLPPAQNTLPLNNTGNGIRLTREQYMALLIRNRTQLANAQAQAQAQLSGQVHGQVPNQLVNQVTNPTIIQRRFAPQLQNANTQQQQVDIMRAATQQQLIRNNQAFMVQSQFPINQQLQGIISDQTPQLQLNMPQMALYRRPNVVQRPVAQQQVTLNTQFPTNGQWVFQQRPWNGS